MPGLPGLGEMAKITRVPAPNGWIVRLSGPVDEQFDGTKAFDGLTNTVIVDLDEVDRITSFGVREWVQALHRIGADYYAFVRCRPAIVTQFNMVADFGVQGHLVSFYVPYECMECGEYFEVLTDLRRDYGEIASLNLQAPPCPKCSGETELDDVPEQYFSYVLSKPEPVVPAAAQRLIDGSTTEVPQRLMITKEIKGQVTGLWLSGNLDEAGRMQRLLEGLEGLVVLEFSKVTFGTEKGWTKLWQAVSKSGSPRLYLARIPTPILKLPEKTNATPPPVLVSVLLRKTCLVCNYQSSLEVSREQIAKLTGSAEAIWACPQCGSDLDFRDEIASLQSSDPNRIERKPPQVGDYLRHRPVAGAIDSDAVAQQRSSHPTVVEGVTTGEMGTYERSPTSEATPPAEKNKTRLASIQPTPFGKYLLIAKLGHGGMGEVYLALSGGVGGFRKLVVIKRLHPYYVDESRLVDMFLDEARLAARLNHPNVIQTTEVGEHDGLYYLTMEYLEGQSLDRIFRRARQSKAPVPTPVLCKILADAMDGLHYAHELKDFNGTHLGVVHRDISPGNIVVTYQGVTKVVDFGVAKAKTQMAATETGAFKGKISYMAPEQIWGSGVDRRADIWSSGMVLYEGLTGSSLFRKYSDAETLSHLMNTPIEPLLASMPNAPPELAKAIRGTLRRDPDTRISSALELRRLLEEYLVKRPTTREEVSAYVRDVFADAIDERKKRLAHLVETAESEPPAGGPESIPVEVDVTSSEPPTEVSDSTPSPAGRLATKGSRARQGTQRASLAAKPVLLGGAVVLVIAAIAASFLL